jgi:DNA-binding LacI/PurR family transcriptional regulator
MPTRVTLKQVAAQAGVSYQTVSKVINRQAQVSKETEERIWRVVQQLGYRPSHLARSLRSQRSRTIGYSWPPSPLDQYNPILDQFLQSLVAAAEEDGYYILIFPYQSRDGDPLHEYRELIDTGRVDGFILSAVEYDDRRIRLLIERNFPFVAFGRSNLELDFPYIDVDGGQGIRAVTEHLLEQGHRRIAALAWPETSRVGNNRLEGYLTAMRNAGIPPRPEWIARGEGRYAFGREATLRWLDAPENERITAIVAVNDAMAIGAMHAIQERGLRVGPDISVTGFDDAPMAQYLSPPLTTLRQPVWEIGQRLVKMLLDRLNGKRPAPYRELIAPRLIVRPSSLGWRPND